MDLERADAWARHRVAELALREFTLHTMAAGIASIPVKGVVVGHLVYDDFAERPIGDVDVLARRCDLGGIVAIAKARGWRVVRDSKVPGCLNVVVRGTAIDIATTVKPAGMCAISVETMIARAAERVEPLGFRHLEVEWHDHMLVLAADAFKDRLDAKRHVRTDLVRMVAHPGFNPETFVARAVEATLATMVHAVADWVLETDVSPGWAAIRDRLARERIREAYLVRWQALCRTRPAYGSCAAYRLAVLTRLVSDSAPRRAWSLALGVAGTAAFVLRHRTLATAEVWRRERVYARMSRDEAVRAPGNTGRPLKPI